MQQYRRLIVSHLGHKSGVGARPVSVERQACAGDFALCVAHPGHKAGVGARPVAVHVKLDLREQRVRARLKVLEVAGRQADLLGVRLDQARVELDGVRVDLHELTGDDEPVARTLRRLLLRAAVAAQLGDALDQSAVVRLLADGDFRQPGPQIVALDADDRGLHVLAALGAHHHLVVQAHDPVLVSRDVLKVCRRRRAADLRPAPLFKLCPGGRKQPCRILLVLVVVGVLPHVRAVGVRIVDVRLPGGLVRRVAVCPAPHHVGKRHARRRVLLAGRLSIAVHAGDRDAAARHIDL